MRILGEADVWDDGLVAGACEWLQVSAPAEGGASFTEPAAEGWPLAPGGPRKGPAGVADHDRADRRHPARPGLSSAPGRSGRPSSCGRASTSLRHRARERRAALRRPPPDRASAGAAFGRLGPLLFDGELVVLDPDAPGEVDAPPDLARQPGAPVCARAGHDLAHLNQLQRASRCRWATLCGAPAQPVALDHAGTHSETASQARLLPGQRNQSWPLPRTRPHAARRNCQ